MYTDDEDYREAIEADGRTVSIFMFSRRFRIVYKVDSDNSRYGFISLIIR